MFRARKRRKEQTLKFASLMKISVGLVACLIALPLIDTPGHAEDLKIAKVSYQDIFKNSARVKAELEALKKVREEGSPKIASLSQEVKAIDEQLKKAGLKEEEKKKLETDRQNKLQELQSEQQSVRVRIAFKQRSFQNILTKQIEEVLAKIAKETKLQAVFVQESLAYSGDGVIDLTDRVTKELDAMPALEKEKP
jgi:Skp family chaperone for outer membrane proteins